MRPPNQGALTLRARCFDCPVDPAAQRLVSAQLRPNAFVCDCSATPARCGGAQRDVAFVSVAVAFSAAPAARRGH